MLGFRPAFTSTSGKPIGPQRIDWINPITLGMFDCLLWTEGGGVPVNLAVPRTVTTVTGTPKWTMSPAGLAGYASGGAFYNIPDHGNIVAADFTMRVLFRPVTWSGGFQGLIDKSVAGPTRELTITCDASGNIDAAIVGGTNLFTATTAMTAGQVWDFVILRTGTDINVYVNGIFIADIGTGGTTAVPTAVMSFGGGATSSASNIEYISSQIWKRALSPSEIWQLYAGPYCFLTPVEGEIPKLFFLEWPPVGTSGPAVRVQSNLRF